MLGPTTGAEPGAAGEDLGGADGDAPAGLAALPALYLESAHLVAASARLQRSLLAWLATGLVVSAGGAAAVAQLSSPRAALAAGLGGLGWWLAVGVALLAGVPLLVTPSGRRLDFVGVPNGLSAVRAWSCMPLILCAALPLGTNRSLLLWCALGGPAGLLDLVDGWVARRFGPVTALGKALDPAGDAVFFSMAAVGNLLVGIIPAWLMALLLLRYLGPLLAAPVVLLGGRRPELVHTVWGRRNTLFTGVVLFTCMWVRIFNGPVGLVALVLGIPLIGVTTVLHFASLWRRVAQAPGVRPTR